MKKIPDIFAIQKSYKGILLDLDHTLYDYESCNLEALHACHRFFNTKIQKISFEKFHTLYLAAREAVKKKISGKAGSRSRYLYFQVVLDGLFGETCSKYSLKLGDLYWKSYIKKMSINPWVPQFLKDARDLGVKIVIVTNQETSLQFKKLIRLKIEKDIDFMVTSEEAGVEKPNPQIFKIALNKIGMKPKEVIMIGDNAEEDGKGAKNARISFFHVVN